MKSTVTLEKSKTQVAKEKTTAVIAKLQIETDEARTRGIASAEQAANILEGARPWRVKEECKVFDRASLSSRVLGKYAVGKKLLGIEEKDSWVKVKGGTGRFVFVKNNCGAFD